MTLADIRELVLAADPDACAYESDSTGEDYTTWQPLWPMNLLVDNRYADGWHFVIDRFTRMQDDPITANIRAVLDDAPGVAYAMEIDYEQDTGFLHPVAGLPEGHGAVFDGRHRQHCRRNGVDGRSRRRNRR